MKGQVKNHSSYELWVVESDTDHCAVAHKLSTGRKSPEYIDADGFRAIDGTPIDGHTSWVKIVDLSTAIVEDGEGALKRGCLLCRNVGEDEFGEVRFDSAEGWGDPISRFSGINPDT